MDIVKLSISRPVGVAVAVLLLVMFGLIGLTAIPVQLTPSIDRPSITVTTAWPGRSPEEVVDEITKEQEEQLKNVESLKKMRSVSRQGGNEISLEFFIGADIGRALQEVSDALRQVPSYPEEVDEPVIAVTGSGGPDAAIAWMIIDVKPEQRDLHQGWDIANLYDALDKEMKPFLERIPGVAEVNIYGGREREVRVLVDPRRLADRRLGPQQIIDAIRGENTNVSAGTIAEGKRDYRIRVVGQFEDPQEILDVIVAYREGKPVYVRDVASVELSLQKPSGFVRSMGAPCIAFNLIRQSGSNVVDIMDELRVRLDEVRADVLPNIGGRSPAGQLVGPDLRLRQVYDETTYITSSIKLVTQNLYIGGFIAALVLVLFLRSLISTGVIALAIPISVIGTFLALLVFGRTLNVVSLAGLAFAVGMVVDNAIVVLENIYRRIQLGEPAMKAAYRGGKEVWGAILASTLTTAAVFVPVLTVQEEAGQLFRDISLAIVSSVTLSLIVSITVIPAACSRWLHAESKDRKRGPLRTAWRDLAGLAPLCAVLVRKFGDLIHWLITGVRGWTLRPAVIIAMTALSVIGAMRLAPPMDYLPAGNRNLVFGGVLAPPGLSIDKLTEMAEQMESVVKPYLDPREGGLEDEADLQPIYGWGDAPPYQPLRVENFFIGAFQGGMFAGATSAEEQVVVPVGQLVTNAMNGMPDAFGGARQTSLFGGISDGGNTIDIEISGPDLERVTAAANMVYGIAGDRYGFGQSVTADPANFNLTQQEYRVRLTKRGRELGLSTRELGTAVRALFDGAFAGEFRLDGDNIDLVVLPEGGRLAKKEDLADIPVATPAGATVPMSTVVEIVPTTAPQDIQRIEELAAVTIKINPPEGRALQSLMAELDGEIIQQARDAGLIDRTMRVKLEGTAAKLDEVRGALFGYSGGITGDGESARLVGGAVALGGLLVAGFVGFRAVSRRRGWYAYGIAGALLISSVIGLLLYLAIDQPQLATARMVWALIVTYLLMCALFESFVYPFVIMFSVPLAVVGGFAGLSIVHDRTAADPLIATQQLDTLTMLGFVILIGVVVNNAILLVHQALNYMRGQAEEGEEQIEPMNPHEAIAQSVRTRVRPIFMSSMTSVGGMLPLVLFPGAGSEMYRGLGSVVIGGLLCSTVFTLVLVPLLFSLTVDMANALRSALRPERRESEQGEGSGPELQPA